MTSNDEAIVEIGNSHFEGTDLVRGEGGAVRMAQGLANKSVAERKVDLRELSSPHTVARNPLTR